MKKIMIHLTIFFFLFVYIGCVGVNYEDGIYKEGYAYYFLVTKENEKNEIIREDTLVMIIGDFLPWYYRLIARDQKGTSWKSQKSGREGARGITDNKESLSIQVPTSKFIEGHFIGFAGVIAPYPQTINGIPPKLENTIYIEHSLPRNYGSVDGEVVMDIGGKTIESEAQYTKTEYCSITFTHDSVKCWIMEGENVSHIDEFGRYIIKAWFTEEYGFVKWNYETPERELIEFKLVKIMELN